MRFLSLLPTFFGTGIVYCQAVLPRSLDFKLKDSLSHPPKGWIKQSPAPADHTISLRLGLKQNGIEAIREHLEKSSDPFHPLYGQHLSTSEVDSLSSPSDESLSLVYDWLNDHGIPQSACQYSNPKDWITLSLPVSLVEQMLNTTYYVYKHESAMTSIVRTERYSLPSFIHEHVDLVTPTNYFSRMHAKKKGNLFRSVGTITETDSGSISKVCNTSSVTSECLRTFYGSIDYVVKAADRNSVGVTGYLGEAANMADLRTFLQGQRPEAVNATFSVVLINGGENPQLLNQTQIENGVGVEANLDVQTVTGVVFPTPETFFSTGGSAPFIPDDLTPTDTNEPYLQWLEFVLNQKTLPNVVTTSYDDDEQTVPKDLATRVCNDFMRLGARGVSVLFGSGDDGVGVTGECFTNDGKNKTAFLPEFPSTCPFVTSVGATKNFNPEVAAEDFSTEGSPFFSGGGFSNYFERPSYQDKLVGPYVNRLGNLNKGLFNPNGRAIPDVAAQGSNYKIIWQNMTFAVSGTSASTPLFSSFVTLLNDLRLSKGLPALGFLNPWLYSVGFAGLNDITIGNSSGCGTNGFPAAQGWDAVTGLGTPNFTKLEVLAVL